MSKPRLRKFLTRKSHLPGKSKTPMTKLSPKSAPQSVALPVGFGADALVGRDSVEPRS
jgi:hypothetical protein